MKTIAELYNHAASKFGNRPAFLYRDKKGKGKEYTPVTYKQLLQTGENLGCALIELGLKPRENVGVIADNRIEWILADAAVQLNGAVNVPRGSDATDAEAEYILGHADCRIVFAENDKMVEKIRKIQPKTQIKYIIVMDADFKGADDAEIFTLAGLVKKGETLRNQHIKELKNRSQNVKGDDLFTIIYTSGTTGNPKGVMLANSNIMFQVDHLPSLINLGENERFLSILPVWHIFERAAEYVAIYMGAATYYTNVRDLKTDIQAVKPTFMTSAPRLWEKIYEGILQKLADMPKLQNNLFQLAYNINQFYRDNLAYIGGAKLTMLPEDPATRAVRTYFSAAGALASFVPAMITDQVVLKKIREAFGGELKATISGGGALPRHVDEFFSNIGVLVLEGYGMTETAPVIACRTPQKPVVGSVGPVFTGTQVRLLDDQGREVPQGQSGVIWVSGPQVMKGYYKEPAKTAEVLKDGWLNTGDIGVFSANGTLSITGRAKDTIVLLGGENVEPVPIENKILESELVDQVIVVGQDQKTLKALVWPNLAKLGVDEKTVAKLNTASQEFGKIMTEIKKRVSGEAGFKSFERITDFRFLPKPMEVGDEITNLFKMKRNVIAGKYKHLIDEMEK